MPSVCYTTDADTWCAWVTNTTCTTSTASGVWRVWTATTNTAACDCAAGWATTAATSATVVWSAWTTSDNVRVRYVHSELPRELTAEEKAERDRLDAEARERQRVERERFAAEEAAADKRAEELLVAALNAEQKAEYADKKTFRVRTRTGRHYRIRRAWSGHVERLDDAGRPVERFCIHPRTTVPLPDNQLLAKLMLETDEDNFCKIANRTRVPPAPAGVN